MKLENIIVVFVALLMVTVGFFTYRYNTISEDDFADFDAILQQEMASYHKAQEEKQRNYLDVLEQYEDSDVAVDPTKENKKNVVKVNAEETNNAIEESVQTNVTSEYTKQLEAYNDTEPQKPAETTQPEPAATDQPAGTKESNGDTIADDIDAILTDAVTSVTPGTKESNGDTIADDIDAIIGE